MYKSHSSRIGGDIGATRISIKKDVCASDL